MSALRKAVTAAASTALLATGLAMSAPATAADSGTELVKSGQISRAVNGRVAGVAGCNTYVDTVHTDGRWYYYTVNGTSTITSHSWAKLSFVPRALAWFRTDSAGYNYYYAITNANQLYRVRIAPDVAATVSLKLVASGFSDIKDITVGQGNSGAGYLFTLSKGGYLRRGAIKLDGTVGAYSIVKSGMGTTNALTRSGNAVLRNTSTGATLADYNVILGVTSAGQLQQHMIRFSGSGGSATRLTTLASAGWTRFNSVDVANCTGDVLEYLGRDNATSRVFAYKDTDGYNFSGSDISYTGTLGSIPRRTYGA
ncbi:MAG: hypothetical protein LWW86_07745 [Micrococcales bacterium]|nr:hypothetical protein [Micrococcales bacterium]